MKRDTLIRIILTGLFIALGMLLPFLTFQNPKLGATLLLMHIPILICGFACGWPYGLAAGLITPLLRSLLFIMPPLFPDATAMSFELAAYGLLAGLFYHLLPQKPVFTYLTLLIALIGGRLVWGPVRFILAGLSPQAAFSWQMYLAGALLNAIPGIILQIILIPLLVFTLERAGLITNEP